MNINVREKKAATKEHTYQSRERQRSQSMKPRQKKTKTSNMRQRNNSTRQKWTNDITPNDIAGTCEISGTRSTSMPGFRSIPRVTFLQPVLPPFIFTYVSVGIFHRGTSAQSCRGCALRACGLPFRSPDVWPPRRLGTFQDEYPRFPYE